MTSPTYEYSKIEPESPIPKGPQRQSLFLRSYFTSVVAIICIASLASVATYTTIRISDSLSSPSKHTPLRCGNSTAEARALGCTFDPLLFSWLPAECPRDGTEEFLHSQIGGGSWRYWVGRGEERVEMSDYDELSEIGNEYYYTTTGEHLSHCAHILLRSHYVMGRGDRVDMIARNPEHAKHCVMYLLKAAQMVPDYDNITTGGGVYFGSC